MNHPDQPDQTRHDDAWERRLDWGLGENEGGAVAPDVMAKVLARVAAARTHGAPQGPAPASRRSRWLAAALLLLGVAAVVNALLSPRTAPGDVPAQDRVGADPVWHRVESLADVEALPPTATHVLGINLGDAEVAALARRPALAGLRLQARTFASDGAGLRLLSPASLPHLRKLTKLRVLDLDMQQDLTGADLGVLADLPLLEELGLQRFDTDDAILAVLDRMPSLRSLDLTLNHDFHGATMAIIGRLPGLRRLKLLSCSQLSMTMLQPIARLERLEELDVSGIGNGWRGYFAGHVTEAATARRQAQMAAATAAGAGLDATLVDLLPPGLRRLGIGQTTLDDAAIRALCLRLRWLQELDLAECAQITDVAVAQAIGLPRLWRLDLSNCAGLSSISIDLIEQATQLRIVRLMAPWLMPAHVERLLARGIDVELAPASTNAAERDKRADFVQAVAELRRRYADAVEARADGGPFTIVTSAADVAALPSDSTAVEGHDLDDAAVTSLVGRLPQLQRLRLRSGEQTKTYNGSFAPQTNTGNRRDLTDAGIAALAALPDLVELELAGTVAVGDQGIASLQKLPKLGRLHLACFDLTDQALAALPAMPSLRSLQIELSFGFGGAGLRAIAACRQLEELMLGGLPQLQGNDLAELGRLVHLRKLTLANLSTTRNDNERPLSAAEQARRAAALGAAEQPGAGLTDRALLALGALADLEHLQLAWPRISRDGLPAIARMPRLKTLSLIGCTWLTGDDLRPLPRSITTLDLAGCTALDDRVADGLAGMRLQSLNLAQSRALTDDGLARLVAAHPLERFLGLYGCTGLTAASADLLFATARIRELDVTACKGWSKERAEQARADGRRVAFRIW